MPYFSHLYNNRQYWKEENVQNVHSVMNLQQFVLKMSCFSLEMFNLNYCLPVHPVTK